MDLQARKRMVSNQQVCALKYNPDSTIQWYKARLETKVFFSQSYGMDYTENFSWGKVELRMSLFIATNFSWALPQVEVKKAFIHGDLHDEIFRNYD